MPPPLTVAFIALHALSASFFFCLPSGYFVVTAEDPVTVDVHVQV